MKKFFTLLVLISCFVMIGCGCSKKEMSVSFVRFTPVYRQTDYCCDFTLEFKNNSNSDQLLREKDFYICINNEIKDTVTFLHETNESFYLMPIIKIGETIKIRVRAISELNNKQRNLMLVKYKDKILVDDNVYINNTRI